MVIRNINVTGIFVWTAGLASQNAKFVVGDILMYNGLLYKCTPRESVTYVTKNPSDDPEDWTKVDPSIADYRDLIGENSGDAGKIVDARVVKEALFNETNGVARFLNPTVNGSTFIKSWGGSLLSDIVNTSSYVVTVSATNILDWPVLVSGSDQAIINTFRQNIITVNYTRTGNYNIKIEKIIVNDNAGTSIEPFPYYLNRVASGKTFITEQGISSGSYKEVAYYYIKEGNNYIYLFMPDATQSDRSSIVGQLTLDHEITYDEIHGPGSGSISYPINCTLVTSENIQYLGLDYISNQDTGNSKYYIRATLFETNNPTTLAYAKYNIELSIITATGSTRKIVINENESTNACIVGSSDDLIVSSVYISQKSMYDEIGYTVINNARSIDPVVNLTTMTYYVVRYYYESIPKSSGEIHIDQTLQELITFQKNGSIQTYSVRVKPNGSESYGEWSTVMQRNSVDEIFNKYLNTVTMLRALTKYQLNSVRKYETEYEDTTGVSTYTLNYLDISDIVNFNILIEVKFKLTVGGVTNDAFKYVTAFSTDILDALAGNEIVLDDFPSETVKFIISRDTNTPTLINFKVESDNNYAKIIKVIKYLGDVSENTDGSDYFNFRRVQG